MILPYGYGRQTSGGRGVCSIRTHADNGGVGWVSKIGEILRTSLMDGPQIVAMQRFFKSAWLSNCSGCIRKKKTIWLSLRRPDEMPQNEN